MLGGMLIAVATVLWVIWKLSCKTASGILGY